MDYAQLERLADPRPREAVKIIDLAGRVYEAHKKHHAARDELLGQALDVLDTAAHVADSARWCGVKSLTVLWADAMDMALGIHLAGDEADAPK